MRKKGIVHEETKQKIKDFVLDVYCLTANKSAEVNLSEMASKHKVSQIMTSVLHQAGFIKKVSKGTYKWVGNEPDQVVMRHIIKEFSNKQFMYGQRHIIERRKKNLEPKFKFDGDDKIRIDPRYDNMKIVSGEQLVGKGVFKRKQPKKKVTKSYLWGLYTVTQEI